MSAGNDREFIDRLQAKEEYIREIAKNPEKAYELIRELMGKAHGSLGVTQGKHPWDYPENWELFEIRDKRDGKVYPMEFTRKRLEKRND